jgi:predicted ATPase
MHDQDNITQRALKIAACFGISFSVDMLKILTRKYHNLQTTVEEVLVEEGFIDYDGSDYRFVHDKVREAAYSLMDKNERDQCHFDIGMTLLRSLDPNKEDSSTLFVAANQINRCPPTMIQDTSQGTAIMKLNYKAGIKSMECSNFTAAHLYFKASASMLPEDTWKSNYDFSLRINFYYANSSYCCGYVEEARDILEKVIENGASVDDRSKLMLDSYSLLVSLFFLSRKDLPRAFSMCLKVLRLLGEDLPNDAADDQEFVSIVTKAKALFLRRSTDQLLSVNEEITRRNAAIMEFYDQLVVVSYFFRPKQCLCPYFIARWAHFCLSNKICCKYTPGR